MLKKPLEFSREVSLICNSGIQHLDFALDLEGKGRFSRTFLELQTSMRDGGLEEDGYQLIALEEDPETGKLYELPGGRNRDDEESLYTVSLREAASAFEDVWLPMPFLHLLADHKNDASRFARGPSNWARMRLTRLPEPDEDGNTHRLVVVFDTKPSSTPKQSGKPYPCPDLKDIQDQVKFELAQSPLQHFWFLGEGWVTEWLQSVFRKAIMERKIRQPLRDDDQDAVCAHWAYYSVLVEGLGAVMTFPHVYFLDTLSRETPYTPIDVDLVLDIGNSRTCGVLIETSTRDGLDLRDSTALEMRDLGRPHHVYNDPFRSHVEFAWPDFGPYNLSRKAGNDAFVWPSLMRVGHEALRLNGKSTGTDGETGISAPKRYLLDEEQARQLWYFNTAESQPDSAEEGAMASVEGELMAYVTADGDLLAEAENPVPAIQAKFPRAALFSFMLMEILLQAVQQINSVSLRGRRTTPLAPRQLRNIIMTVPSATPLVELKAFRRRAETAISLLWECMGWNTEESSGAETGAPPKPELVISYDEASCTQILYLYTEVAKKFRRPAKEYFSLNNVHASTGGGEAATNRFRLASLDIGGGTTDLMIATYEVRPDGGDAINIKQNFREGFRLAGDDILEAIVAQHVIQQIENALAEKGMANARQFLRGIITDTGKDARARHRRRLFVTQVLVPVALGMLARYENASMFDTGLDPEPFSAFFEEGAGPADAVVEFFEKQLPSHVREEFSLREMQFATNFQKMARTVSSVMGEKVISKLAAVISRFSCKALLVSGRPSRLPVIRDLLLRTMPVAPHNLLFMHDYEIGGWYPFASLNETIEDPKTTVVVGALLCALAERRKLEGFALAPGGFRLLSTARFIGPMNLDGTISDDRIFFSSKNGEFETESLPMEFTGPVQIGFRQLADSNWPATRLYHADFKEASDPLRIARTTPWHVIFRRDEPDEEDEFTPASRRKELDESFRIGEIADREGQRVRNSLMELRLQTLSDRLGYWLDTGRIKLD